MIGDVEHFCPEVAQSARESVVARADEIRAAVAAANPDVSTSELTLLQENAVVYEEEAAIVQQGAEQCAAARLNIAIGRAGAFLMGAVFSATVGFVGMNMAVQGNVRVAAAAVAKRPAIPLRTLRCLGSKRTIGPRSICSRTTAS